MHIPRSLRATMQVPQSVSDTDYEIHATTAHQTTIGHYVTPRRPHTTTSPCPRCTHPQHSTCRLPVTSNLKLLEGRVTLALQSRNSQQAALLVRRCMWCAKALRYLTAGPPPPGLRRVNSPQTAPGISLLTHLGLGPFHPSLLTQQCELTPHHNTSRDSRTQGPHAALLVGFPSQ